MVRKSRSTLMEIAKAANVSATTVSNVVNGRLHLMSDDTRRRVEAIIQERNYRPNEGARNLRLSQRRTVGLIVIHESPSFLADPMITNIVAGISNYLGVNGYGLLLTGIRNAAIDGAQMLRRDQTDALCIIPSGSVAERRALYHLLRDTGQPILVFQDKAPDYLQDTLSIRQDDLGAGELIAERIIARGARKLAFLTPAQNWPAMASRQQGVRQVAEHHGVPLDIIMSASESVPDTQTAIDRYVDRSGLPEAFVGGNDQMAIAALTWAQDRKLTVPGDVRVVGFNGFDFASYVRPVLTTVKSQAYEMGKQGATQLLRRFANGRFDTAELLFPVDLQAGDSD